MKRTLISLINNVKGRGASEKPFINWYVMIILTFLTCGLYGLYVFFQRIKTLDLFILRKVKFYKIVINFTKHYAVSKNGAPLESEQYFRALDDFAGNDINNIKPIGAFKTIFLMFATLGFYFFTYSYKMNKIWNDIQNVEQNFYSNLNPLWHEISLTEKNIVFHSDASLNSSYFLNLFLVFVTCGLWLLVWDYKMHTAADKLFPTVHECEDEVMEAAERA